MPENDIEFELELSAAGPGEKPATPPSDPGGAVDRHRFEADLDVFEVDERLRPGAPWSARARELSRHAISFVARRMTYPGSMLGIAVHLIDARPVVLYGRVMECEYAGGGRHRSRVEFEALPDTPEGDALKRLIRDGGAD